MKRYIIQLIPSALTLCNLALGFAAIAMSDPFYSMVFICIAVVFDGLDGLAARALNAMSAIGKQLDSLADMVTFGVAPAVLIYQHLLHPNYYSVALAATIPVFAAIRLARFNEDPEQNTTFRGLPTPSAALLLAPLPFIDLEYGFHLYGNPLLTAILIATALLMVIPLPMFSFKGIRNPGPDRVFPILLLTGATVMLLTLRWQAIPLIIVLYVLLSLVYSIWKTSAFHGEK